MRTMRSKPSHYELPPISEKEFNEMKRKWEQVSYYAQEILNNL